MAKVTSLAELKKIKTEDIVELGEFEDGTMLTVRMKKISAFNLITSKKLPNRLLKAGTELVQNNASVFKNLVSEDMEVASDAIELSKIILEETMLEPSYKDIKKCGLELTVEQLNNALLYSLGGLKSLENFRTDKSSDESDIDSE